MRRYGWLAIVLAVVAAACARRMAPLDVRAVTTVQQTPGITASEAYQRALVWIAQTHDKVQLVPASQDAAARTVTASGQTQCMSHVGAGLRRMGLGRNQSFLRFNLALTAEDGRMRLTFSELYYYLTDMRYPGSELQQGPATAAEVATLHRDCLAVLEMSLLHAVTR